MSNCTCVEYTSKFRVCMHIHAAVQEKRLLNMPDENVDIDYDIPDCDNFEYPNISNNIILDKIDVAIEKLLFFKNNINSVDQNKLEKCIETLINIEHPDFEATKEDKRNKEKFFSKQKTFEDAPKKKKVKESKFYFSCLELSENIQNKTKLWLSTDVNILISNILTTFRFFITF